MNILPIRVFYVIIIFITFLLLHRLVVLATHDIFQFFVYNEGKKKEKLRQLIFWNAIGL